MIIGIQIPGQTSFCNLPIPSEKTRNITKFNGTREYIAMLTKNTHVSMWDEVWTSIWITSHIRCITYRGKSFEEDFAKGECLAKLLRRIVDENKNVIVHYRADTHFNTALYALEFADNEERTHAANVIADNIYTKVNQFSRCDLIFIDIINHHRNSKYAVKKKDQHVTINGNQHSRRTAAGYEFLLLCKSKTEEWLPLKDLKESTQLQLQNILQLEV